MTKIEDLFRLIEEQDRQQIVAEENGESFNRRDLVYFFNSVANIENWKRPIDTFLDLKTERERAGVLAAIRLFTGSQGKLTPVPSVSGCSYHIEAPGYYATVGA